MIARRRLTVADVGELPRAARVVSDREGGIIALDPVRAGELVVRATISPPLKLKAVRRWRRAGIWTVMVINACLLLLELFAIGAAWWWCCW